MKEKGILTKRYYTIYTLLFIAMALCIFGQFIYYGKAMIEYHDALHQYYASFEYFSDYMQDIFRTLFTTGHLEIPLWDFNIGMGGDVLTSLNYYVIGDPLNLIAVFFKNEQLELVFQLLILFRLYLAGLAFSLFCRKIGFQGRGTMVGAFIYSFSAFALYTSCMYAAFPNVLIYLPLLLLGIEKVFRRESRFMLLFIVALCLISNFYFSYMLAALSVVYFFLRYFVVNRYVLRRNGSKGRKPVVKDLLYQVGRMIPPVIGGALLSCVILLPVLYAFLHQGRGAGQVLEKYLFYDLRDYIELLGSAFSPKISSNFNLMGYCPIVFFAVLLAFQKIHRRKRIKYVLRAAFVVCGIFLCVPVFGYALNGFAYLNNRWIFGLAFLSAVTVAVFFDELLEMNRKKQVVLVLGTAVYLLLYVFSYQMHTMAISVGLVWLLVFLIWLLAGEKVLISRNRREIVLAAVCLLCITHFGSFFFSPRNTEILQTKLNAGEIQDLEEKKSAGAVKCIRDDSFYRVDVMDSETLNEGLLFGYSPVSFYYSLFDGRITAFNKELDNSNMTVPNLSHGNGGRTYLNLLTDVKYVVADRKKDMPFGYRYYDKYELEDETKKIVAKNSLKLPFGYTVDSCLTREAYDKLPPLKKEQAMIQRAVLEQKPEKMPESEPQYTDRSLAYRVKETDGLELKKNSLEIQKSYAALTLEADVPENAELFVSCQGIKFIPYDPAKYPQYYEGDELEDRYDKVRWAQQFADWKEPTQIVVSAEANGRKEEITLQQKSFKYFWNQDSFLLTLGAKSAGKQEIKLTFSNVGKIHFSKLELLAEDMTTLPQQVETLKSERLANIKFASNWVEGTIETKGNRMLMLSVPYSEGWKLTVDGKEKELACVNTMWSGVYLEEGGRHRITLQYRTPGLKVGILISGVTLVVMVVLFGFLWYRRRKRV